MIPHNVRTHFALTAQRLPRALTLAIALGFLPGCDMIGGAWHYAPRDLPKRLSPEARALLDSAFIGIDPARLRDYHVHLAGLNTAQNGTYVNENWQSLLTGGFHYLQFQVYLSAAGVTDVAQADTQYLERLVDLIRHMPRRGRFGIMAFDYFHDEQGQPRKSLSTFHVPNDYVMNIALQYPEFFFPIISIHPYRTDAAERLQHYAEQGARFVKWLPNSMGIHPASPSMARHLDAYYRTMCRYDMTLISHTGDEKATEAEEFQHYGNPLFLRAPLAHGVKVVMAHLASLGECGDADADLCTVGTPYLELAIDMLEDPAYDGLLFADISALTQDNRKDHIDTVLEHPAIHDRLINGSDYPLPAVNIVIQTRSLEAAGYITAEERAWLNEIYDVNPLLFDFVLKRTLRHTATGAKFPATVFLEHPALPTQWSSATVNPS